MRIRVSDILEMLAQGVPEAEDIRECLHFAASRLDSAVAAGAHFEVIAESAVVYRFRLVGDDRIVFTSGPLPSREACLVAIETWKLAANAHADLVDTNVRISAALSPKQSIPVVSRETYAELEDRMGRAKFGSYLSRDNRQDSPFRLCYQHAVAS